MVIFYCDIMPFEILNEDGERIKIEVITIMYDEIRERDMVCIITRDDGQSEWILLERQTQ